MIPRSASDIRRRSFYRKIAYVVTICVLLMPLFWLSHPATPSSAESKGRRGGVLASLREKHELSQTRLGEVDLSSETIKLGTLGMRGIAVQVLWHKANKYQMKKDWTSLRAALEQITKLQPHFVAVWRHQAWNISYNVSVAFDDYHDKFYWIVEGIKYLQRGLKYNRHEPRMPWDVGWFISNKIGKHDDARLLRRLFEKEPYFGNAPAVQGQDEEVPTGLPPNPGPSLGPRPYDNWLVGKAWFREAEGVLEKRPEGMLGGSVAGISKTIFFSDAPLAQIYYAEALEKEGRFGGDKKTGIGGVAQRAWATAARDWYEFGNREFPAAEETTIHLNDLEKHEKAIADYVQALDAISPGLRDQIRKDRIDRLRPTEKQVRDMEASKRTDQQKRQAEEIDGRLKVSNEDVARRLTGDSRRQADELLKKIKQTERLAESVRLERSKVNFEYWRQRTQLEQTPEAIEARKSIFEGGEALRGGRIKPARTAFEHGFKLWRGLLDKLPSLLEDRDLGLDLVEAAHRYRKAVDQDDGKFPEKFILQDILDRYEEREQKETKAKPEVKK